MKKSKILLLALATAAMITSCANTDIQGNLDPQEPENQGMMGGIGGMQIPNPIKTYNSAEELTAILGFTVIPLPESENISFSTISDDIAQVGFTHKGIDYTLRADDNEKDVSGVYTSVESENTNEVILPDNISISVVNKKLSDGNILIFWSNPENMVHYSLYIQGEPENINEIIDAAVRNNVSILTDYKEIYRKPKFEWTEIRTNMSGEVYDFPNTAVITSKEELNEYYNTNKDIYFLERVEKVYSDTTIGFLDEADKYDEKFFEDNLLIFVILENGSGSIRQKVTKVECSELRTRITLKSITPEICTDDMAYWHVFVSIPKSEFLSDNIEIAWEK